MSEEVCRLCGRSGPEPWFDLNRGLILRCGARDCGVGYLRDQPDDEQLAAYYDEYYYPEHGGSGVFENSTVSKSVQHYIALDNRLGLARTRLVDYGCGVGNFLKVALDRGADVVGVEFDDQARAVAAERGLAVHKTIDELEASSSDLVYMNDVIEHLRDPVSELAAVRTRLKPGGAMFVVTMNMRGVKARLLRDRWDVVTNPTHLWLYDAVSLTRTLREAGFGRVEVQRWPVRFDHHGAVRNAAQRALQRFGLDTSLRVLAFPDEPPR